jgi:regulator of sigma E protease
MSVVPRASCFELSPYATISLMITTLIIFLLILSVLVLIHEAGHYLASRAFGVKADEFGYGLPPRIIGFVKVGKKWKRVGLRDQKQYEHTIWSLNWLPIGGFVRIKGEQGEGEHDKDSFHSHPIWQRIVILSAGVGMNWILAVVLISVGLMIGTPGVVDDLPAGADIRQHEISVMEILPGSPADKAGIKPNDAIVKIGDVPAEKLEQTRSEIASHGTNPTTVTILRDDRVLTVEVTPVYLEAAKRNGIGVGLIETGVVRYPPLLAIKNGVVLTGLYTKDVALSLIDLFRDIVSGGGETVSQVSGPVGIAVFTGRVAKQGIMPLLQFAAILSINLAVVNFLPIPALDGGRAVFLVVEGLRRKAMNRKTEALVHNISFLFLLLIIVLVTVRDLARYGGAIVNGLKGLVGM